MDDDRRGRTALVAGHGLGLDAARASITSGMPAPARGRLELAELDFYFDG
jgi:hypothetical protein